MPGNVTQQDRIGPFWNRPLPRILCWSTQILVSDALFLSRFTDAKLEKTLESSLDCKEIEPVNPKGNQSWVFIGRTNANTLATWCEELTHWKRPWCWERLKAGEERDDRRWDGWMASLTRWTWVWASFGSWWWTGKPGVLQPMGLQRVRHDWATELKITTTWKRLTTWWSWAHSSQTSWSLNTALLPHHQPIRELCMSWLPTQDAPPSGHFLKCFAGA